jgi:hypothetical protein
MLFQPKLLVGAAAFVAVAALLGYLSLRILRRLADFEHKREMVSGARWAWAAALLLVAVAYAAAYFGVTLTRYVVTSAVSGEFLLLACLAILIHMFPRQADGAMFAFFSAGQRIRGKEVSAASWLEVVARRKRLERYFKVTHVFLLAMTALGYAFLVLAITYPMDAAFAAWTAQLERARTVAEVVRAGIAQANVQEVSAFGPHEVPDLLSDAGSMKQVAKSVREILKLGRPEEQPGAGDFHLFIRVTKDTTARQARDILAQTEKLLADRHEQHRWRIAVYSRESELSIHGLYPPAEGGG